MDRIPCGLTTRILDSADKLISFGPRLSKEAWALLRHCEMLVAWMQTL